MVSECLRRLVGLARPLTALWVRIVAWLPDRGGDGPPVIVGNGRFRREIFPGGYGRHRE